MKNPKILVTTLAVLLLQSQQALADNHLPCVGASCSSVPEIDGGSAIIAIGLVAGLVALVREKFYK